jgi:hypothetical protein
MSNPRDRIDPADHRGAETGWAGRDPVIANRTERFALLLRKLFRPLG